MKKVMIVGAGAGQCPLIRRCKELGLFTIVISPFGPYPGISLADKHIDEDIFNKDQLVRIGSKEGIDYVISDQSDYAVPIVAYVAEKLGLPGNSIDAAETYTYKSKFRKFCHDHGIPSPKSIVINTTNINLELVDGLTFPVVVKPADSQGSRGITKVSDISDIEGAIIVAAKYSRNDKVVVEEFFTGREIVCEGFVINGEYFNVAFGEREYFSLENLFIPSKTKFPADISVEAKEFLINNEQKISSFLKPAFGIVHSEYLINEYNGFVVIESALRGGGVYIASHLIPLSTGINLTDALLYAMMGETKKCKKLLRPSASGAAEYLCFYLQEGTVTSVEGQEKIQKDPNVLISEIDNITPGDYVPKFEHKGMRKGPFIIKGTDNYELKTTENYIKDNLRIEVNGEPAIIWQ